MRLYLKNIVIQKIAFASKYDIDWRAVRMQSSKVGNLPSTYDV